jgi:hypothetical protein
LKQGGVLLSTPLAEGGVKGGQVRVDFYLANSSYAYGSLGILVGEGPWSGRPGGSVFFMLSHESHLVDELGFYCSGTTCQSWQVTR